MYLEIDRTKHIAVMNLNSRSLCVRVRVFPLQLFPAIRTYMLWVVCCVRAIVFRSSISWWESICRYENEFYGNSKPYCMPTTIHWRWWIFFQRCHEVNIFIENIPSLWSPGAAAAIRASSVWKWHIQFLINTTRYQHFSSMWYMINYILLRIILYDFQWCITMHWTMCQRLIVEVNFFSLLFIIYRLLEFFVRNTVCAFFICSIDQNSNSLFFIWMCVCNANPKIVWLIFSQSAMIKDNARGTND